MLPHRCHGDIALSYAIYLVSSLIVNLNFKVIYIDMCVYVACLCMYIYKKLSVFYRI